MLVHRQAEEVKPMRSAVALIIAAIGACAATGYAQVASRDAGDSLVLNPGFELGEGDAPAGWSYYSWRDSRGWWDSEYAHSGEHSLGLQGPDGGWSTKFAVQPGLVYNLSFHYRADEVPCRFVVYLRYPPGARRMKVLLYKPVTALPCTQRTGFVDGVFMEGADERGWALCDVGDFIPPEGVTELSLLIKLTSDQPGARAWIDDVIVSARQPRSVPDTAQLLVRAGETTVWTDDVNRKILRDQMPPSGEPLRAVRISAAQGEYESFQIAVTPAADMGAVTWTWDTLSGPAELPRDSIRCRRVEYVDIQKTMGPFSHRGLNPDALTDRLPCDIAAGVNQPFWFTVRVPAGQAPGEYDATLTLLAGDEPVCRIGLRLRVRGFEIPRRPTLDTRSAFRWNLMLARESGERDEVLRRYYRSFYEHRTRCSPAALVKVRVDGERAEVDMDEYVEHLRWLRDELGARRVNLPSLWIGHGGDHKMPRDRKWQGIPIFADPELKTLNPAFVAPFRDYMTQLVQRLKDEGLFMEATVRFIDEPNLDDPPTVNGIRALAELIRDIEPKLMIAETCSYPAPELQDVTDLWVLHTDSWARNLAHIARARAAGARIAVYNNAVNYPEHRPIRVRLWPWLLKKYGVDGTYSWWGTVCWRGDMEDPWTAGQGSSGVMMYPPRSADEHGPIESVRWELYREGLEDYEYMALAEKLTEQLEAAGRADVARPGREAVSAALELVERWPNVRAANDEPYTLDVTEVAAARERLADAVEAMTAALER
ncbi:MAG: DUF4091 domain-containing protein [Armatimonadetes bacterium]|nr:DUF4091 domain-containing protein [Armatimonadota bacterium]